MNVRIQYDAEFLGGVYSDHEGLVLNKYTASIQLLTGTNNKNELNTAMERLKCFLYTVLDSTVFMHQERIETATLMQMMGVNVTTLPEEPVDQIIGMMLYCKLNAIMEGRLIVTSVDISSELSEGVWYMHDNEESPGPFVNSGWWDHSGTANNNVVIEVEDDDNKVVKVQPTNSWTEYGLAWPEETEGSGNIVVYANFGRNENDSVQ